MKESFVKIPPQADAHAPTRPAATHASPFERSPDNSIRKTVGVYERPAARRVRPVLIVWLVLVVLGAFISMRLLFWS